MVEFGESSYCRFLQGDQTALEELIRTYSDELVRYAFSFVRSSDVAEELVSDVFAALYMKRKSLRQEQLLRAYLYKMTRSRAIDYLRRHRREVPLEDVEQVLCGESVEKEYLRRFRDEKLRRCVEALPKQYREVLELLWFQGLSMEQAGRVLGRTTRQIYNLHARGKIALRTLLEKEGITREDL
jgi:RNA polymerase sigma-70 factor (ECF subfamily)